VPSNKTFPPKFDKNILYPAELDLDKIDFGNQQDSYNPVTRTGIVGEADLGDYFDVEFYGYQRNATPTLSYGKHAFTISINPNPGGVGSNSPLLVQKSRVLFEVKDAEDTLGNRRTIFSDVTPLYSSGLLKFIGYLWIKPDPLRTYEPLQEGYGYLSIVGLTETNDEFWRNKYNVRSQLPIIIDTTTLVTNDDGTSQYYYNENTSPIIFKNPTKMISGSGFTVTENIIDNTEGDERSTLQITASNLQTYSGRVFNIKTEFWLSGSTANQWQDLRYASHNLVGTEFEEDIDINYSEGINPKTEKWYHEIDEVDLPHGGNTNKVKFRFRFFDVLGNNAITILPISGSSDTTMENFTIEYPTGNPEKSDYVDSDSNWMIIEGSGVSLTGTTIFNSNNPMLLETGTGQFHFGDGVISTTSAGGQRFGPDGNPIDTGYDSYENPT